MILPDFKDFPRRGRVLGIDWGARRTGVAISDEDWVFFWSRPQINATGDESVAPYVAQIANDERVVGIIIGLPLFANGADSQTTAAVREFAGALSEMVDLPIIFVEENLTSVVATENLVGLKRGTIKQKLDSEAARVILENGIGLIKRHTD